MEEFSPNNKLRQTGWYKHINWQIQGDFSSQEGKFQWQFPRNYWIISAANSQLNLRCPGMATKRTWATSDAEFVLFAFWFCTFRRGYQPANLLQVRVPIWLVNDFRIYLLFAATKNSAPACEWREPLIKPKRRVALSTADNRGSRQAKTIACRNKN